MSGQAVQRCRLCAPQLELRYLPTYLSLLNCGPRSCACADPLKANPAQFASATIVLSFIAELQWLCVGAGCMPLRSFRMDLKCGAMRIH